MAQYFVNNSAQPNGDYEVHRADCHRLYKVVNRSDLGYHPNCLSAVDKANIYHPNTANGCIHCSKECIPLNICYRPAYRKRQLGDRPIWWAWSFKN